MKFHFDWNKLLKKRNLYYIITILFIIFIVYQLYSYFMRNKRSKTVEKFESNTEDKYPKNLIKNGNFINGRKPDNYISQSGVNKIIQKQNPSGISNYVLSQEKTSELTYYELQSVCDDSSKYIFYTWVSFQKSEDDVEPKINLSDLIRIRVLNENGTNDIIKPTYKIIQKAGLKDTNVVWYLLSYSFQTGSNTDQLMNIYLNYTESLPTPYVYFSDIRLYKVLVEAENFIYNDGLQLYLDGYHYDSTSKIWNDVSSISNNFEFSSIPYVNTSNGYVKVQNQSLIGPSSSKLFGKSDSPFTFMMMINNENEGTDVHESFSNNVEDDMNNQKIILQIPGNNSYSLQLLWLPDTKQMVIRTPNQKIFFTNENIVLQNKTMFSIVYYTGGRIELYQDSVLLINETVDIFYYSENDKVSINYDKNMDMNLYSILSYDRNVSVNEMKLIREYFMRNLNQNFTNVPANIYDATIRSPFEKLTLENDTITAYDGSSLYNVGDSKFDSTYTNQNMYYRKEAKYCVSSCKELCRPFFDDIGKYRECMRTCKNILPSCKSYCEDNKNKNSLICEVEECKDMNPKKNCPIAYKRLGEYMVYVKPDSFYAKKYHYSGEKSYGKHRENARNMYHKNFPACKVPSILNPGEGENYLNKCPYIIHEGNPCFQSVCEGVNWGVRDYHDLDMSDKCKKSVSYYCHINHDTDEMCKCWKEENRNNPKCIQYRKYFENPSDYCPISQFNIEDHPNFSQYIKKDKIPCFGCKID
jgi:hypothetical protein